MDIELGPVGKLVRVTATEDHGTRVYIEFKNGSTSWFDHLSPESDFEVGDVLLITNEDDDQQVHRVPKDNWVEDPWVGIVKIRLDDITVLDSNGRWRTVPTRDCPCYDVGNTVLAGEVKGVTRVLSKTPLKYIDLPEIDDAAVKKFRWEPDGDHIDFDAFGGLESVVRRARELIEIPLQKHEELSEIGARPIKGVLFTGEPGTGKTMLAKIIATQCDAAFYKISGPEIFSKWYGQSEELLRKLFEAAAAESKAIVFFDEIDSVAAQRGDNSHEASKRVVAQLLTLMDGFIPNKNIVVIAATNRPEDLDDALLRPGRFDWKIDFPYPDERDREDILRKKASQHKTEGDLPHRSIASASAGWSGAELAAIWSEAALLAVEDSRDTILEEDYIGGFERISRYRAT